MTHEEVPEGINPLDRILEVSVGVYKPGILFLDEVSRQFVRPQLEIGPSGDCSSD